MEKKTTYLCLTLRVGDRVVLDETTAVQVQKTGHSAIRLLFMLPPEVRVLRVPANGTIKKPHSSGGERGE